MNKKLWSVVVAAGTLPFLSASAFASEIADPAEMWEELWHELMLDVGVIGTVFFVIYVYTVLKHVASSPD